MRGGRIPARTSAGAAATCILLLCIQSCTAVPVPTETASETEKSVPAILEVAPTSSPTSTSIALPSEAPNAPSSAAIAAEEEKKCECPKAAEEHKEKTQTLEEPEAHTFKDHSPKISKAGFLYALFTFLGICATIYLVKAYCARKRMQDRQI